jgi:hypothetical protein
MPRCVAVLSMFAWILMICSPIGSSVLSGFGVNPSGAVRTCQCPRWQPDGEVLVGSFQCSNKLMRSSVDIVVSMTSCGDFAISWSICWTSVGSESIFGSFPCSSSLVASESPLMPKISVNSLELNGVFVACPKCLIFLAMIVLSISCGSVSVVHCSCPCWSLMVSPLLFVVGTINLRMPLRS